MGPWAANDRHHRGTRVLVGLAVGLGGLVVASSGAGALQPSAGVAVIDGSPAEWTAADDVAAIVGNDPPHLERGRLSLRYDCEEQVLYALLLAGPGLRFEATDAAEAYLRFGPEAKLVKGTDGVDGEAPDAAWIDRRAGTAAGVEMSAPVAPGSYGDLRVHAKSIDDSADGYETLDLVPRHHDLSITCTGAPGVADVAASDAAVEARRRPDSGAGEHPGILARTGAPALTVLAGVGIALLGAGGMVRTRRWLRPARR